MNRHLLYKNNRVLLHQPRKIGFFPQGRDRDSIVSLGIISSVVLEFHVR